MTDEARALAEVAKTAGEIVKAAGGIGGYLARVFGSVPDNLVGLGVGDWLDHKRRRHLATLEANTARHLERIAAERLTEPSPSVLIPLLQAAVDESRPELQAMWAALLANAMVDGGKRVRRDYFEAVRQMEPADAILLDIVRRQPGPGPGPYPQENEIVRFVDNETQRLGMSINERWISIFKLRKLGCTNENWPAGLTPFGIGLLGACTVV